MNKHYSDEETNTFKINIDINNFKEKIVQLILLLYRHSALTFFFSFLSNYS
jgi:hypothetical protein